MFMRWFLTRLSTHGFEVESEQVNPKPEPEPQKQKTEYEKLCEKIQAADGDRYLLSKDEYQVLRDYCESGKIVLDYHEFIKKNGLPFTMAEDYLYPFFEFVREPRKNNLEMHEKQLIPNWPYKGRKKKWYYQ